jgi:L-asparaginase
VKLLARIKLVATGGTIANTERGLISMEEVLESIPQVRALADFEVAEVCRVRGGSLGPDDWLAITRSVSEASARSDVDAIIVTHGTFTLEETAYFVHLTAHTDKPVVCVAAQRMHGATGHDGDRNFLDAVRVALSPGAKGKGALVVLHEEVHSARDVIKTNQRPGGFVSPAHGLLGHVETDQVSFYRSPIRRHTFASEFDVGNLTELPRVDIIAAYVGADDTAARACVDAGARGLVVHGYAFSGSPAVNQRRALEEIAASGVPVVLASRGGAGRVPVVPGSPFIQGDNLPAPKARILLMLALARKADSGQIQKFFGEY